MPTHVPTKTGGVIIWNSTDWKAGLGPAGSFGSNSRLKQVEKVGWNFLTDIDPFSQYGILQPGFQPSPAFTNNSSLGGAVISMQSYNNSNAYGLDGTGGKVQDIQFGSNTISTTSPFPHTITGTSPVGQDCVIYTHYSGGINPSNVTTSFFYSYYNSANWDVGAYVGMTGGSLDDDFMSTIPADPLDVSSGDGDDVTQKTAPHTLCIGSDGILYIGSGRYVHGYDGFTGANGTFNSKVLTLPQGFQIIGMRKYQDVLLIAGNYYTTGPDGVGQAQLYTWNYTDQDISQFIPLEDNYVSALFIWGGTPAVVTSGAPERNGINKVKLVTGISTRKVADFGGAAPVQRGIYVLNKMLYINSGGKIITIGDKYDESSNRINHIANCRTTGTSGVMDFDYQLLNFMASSYGTSTPSFNRLSYGVSGSGQAYGFYFQPEFPTGKEGRIKTVQIEFFSTLAASANNGNLTLVLSVDFGSNATQPITNLSGVTSPLIKRYTLASNGNPFPRFSSIAPQFIWTLAADAALAPYAPQISSLAVEYDFVEIPI